MPSLDRCGPSAGMPRCAFAMRWAAISAARRRIWLLHFAYGGNMCLMLAMVVPFFGLKYYGINYAIATCQMIRPPS